MDQKTEEFDVKELIETSIKLFSKSPVIAGLDKAIWNLRYEMALKEYRKERVIWDLTT